MCLSTTSGKPREHGNPMACWIFKARQSVQRGEDMNGYSFLEAENVMTTAWRIVPALRERLLKRNSAEC